MKKISQILFLFTSISFISCSGQSLLSADAGESEDPFLLTIFTLHHASNLDSGEYLETLQDDGSKLFQNNLGITIRLNALAISWGHLHLIPEGNNCLGGETTEIDVGTVLNLMTNDLTEIEVNSSNIARTEYCEYEIHLESISSSPTLLAEGTWNDGAEEQEFSISIDEEIEISATFMALEGDELIEHALHAHGEETEVSVTFSVIYNQLFDDIEFIESDSEIRERLVNNLQSLFTQYLSTGH